MKVDVRSFAAEFPNDNPRLHRGVRWVCLTTTGRPTAERSEEPFVAPLAAARAVEEAAPSPVAVEAESVVAVEAESVVAVVPESVVAVEAESVVAVEAESVVAVVPESVVAVAAESVAELAAEIVVEELEPMEAALEGEASFEDAGALAFEEIGFAADVVAPRESSVVAAPDDAFVRLTHLLVDVCIGAGAPHAAAALPSLLSGDATAAAWRAILRGESEDFDACGASMLDEWSATLLAGLLGQPVAALRQELRRRGVAAFGLAA